MSDELDRKAIEAHADIVFDRMVRNVLRLILCVGLPIAIVVGAYFWLQHWADEQQQKTDCQISVTMCK